MKQYEIVIKPVSGFGTPLKGDTLFGHFCWQAVYDDGLLDGGLTKWLEVYAQRPFAVFSSAFPRLGEGKDIWYALKRPELPLSWFLGNMQKDKADFIDSRKKLKKARWLAVKNALRLNWEHAELWTDSYLQKKCRCLLNPEMLRRMQSAESTEFEIEFSQPHNSISRLTQTTGSGGMFAPYVKINRHYYPESRLAIFVLVDEDAVNSTRLCKGLERMGMWGYGRDASTGLGRFTLVECNEIPFPDVSDANAAYMMGPSVPAPGSFQNAWFSPFVRFGRHGDRLAVSSNPFKNPVIMADDAAVYQPSSPQAFALPYWGVSVTGVSKAQPGAVTQGYAPYLPFRLETIHETNIPLFD